MNNPYFVKVEDRKYKINTDFRIALKCNEVASDTKIDDYERALALIYLLYGDEGLEAKKDYSKLLELAIKYLRCGAEENKSIEETKPDMDILQDYRLIQASFKSDYGIDLDKENIHWWDFYTYLNGLTDKCVLNRIRELRTYDISQVKNPKDKTKIRKMQEQWALKITPKPLSIEQQKSVDRFYELTGLKRKE